MLDTSDIAVIVRRPDGSQLDCQGRQQTVTTELAGPAGWNDAILGLLTQFTLATSADTALPD
jgi:mannosyl-3-phosphoglycerate phosphatase